MYKWLVFMPLILYLTRCGVILPKRFLRFSSYSVKEPSKSILPNYLQKLKYVYKSSIMNQRSWEMITAQPAKSNAFF